MTDLKTETGSWAETLELNRIFETQNLITLFRLVLAPFVLISLWQLRIKQFLALLTLAGLSDVLDGYIARKTGRVTRIGQLLDHLIDKILVISIVLILYVKWNFPAWAFGIIIFRELGAIVVGWLLLRKYRFVARSNFLGKMAGISFFLLTFAYILNLRPYVEPLIYSTVGFFVLSGMYYAFSYRRKVDDTASTT